MYVRLTTTVSLRSTHLVVGQVDRQVVAEVAEEAGGQPRDPIAGHVEQPQLTKADQSLVVNVEVLLPRVEPPSSVFLRCPDPEKWK